MTARVIPLFPAAAASLPASLSASLPAEPPRRRQPARWDELPPDEFWLRVFNAALADPTDVAALEDPPPRHLRSVPNPPR